MKILMVKPPDAQPPVLPFLRSMDKKMKSKLISLFSLLSTVPPGQLREPYVKHFTIEKYSALYELRARNKNLVRIIFTIRPGGDILLLAPFVKKHARCTMQALDASLKMLSQIQDGTCSTPELTINILQEVLSA